MWRSNWLVELELSPFLRGQSPSLGSDYFSSGSDYLVVGGFVIVPGKREELGVRRKQGEMKRETRRRPDTQSCLASLYLERDTPWQAEGCLRVAEFSPLQGKEKLREAGTVRVGPRVAAGEPGEGGAWRAALTPHFHAPRDTACTSLSTSSFKTEFIFIMLTWYIGDPAKKETLISVTDL